MNTPKLISIIIATSVCTLANAKSDLNSQICGNWKIAALQYKDSMIQSPPFTELGKFNFHEGGFLSGWSQAQDGARMTPITYISGKWSINEDKLTMTINNYGSQTAKIKMRSGQLVLNTLSGDQTTYFLKRTKEDLKKNEVEGIKYDYTISFPEDWSVITADSAQMFPQFGIQDLTAMAKSPNSEGTLMLNSHVRKLSREHLFMGNNNIEEKSINNLTWWFQTIEVKETSQIAITAYTYHNGGTIRMINVFSKDFKNPREIVDSTISSLQFF